MNELPVFLGVAAVGYALAFRLKLPAIPVLIVLGLLLSYSPLAPGRDSSYLMVEFGLAFLVFAAGIELSPRRFTHQTSAVLWVAIVQFASVGLLCILAASGLGYGQKEAVYIGFAVSASSTLVVIRHLRAQQQMFQPFGRLVTGVLLVQDVALIVVLVVMSSNAGGWQGVVQEVGGLLFLAGVAAFCHYRLFPWISKRLQSDDESLLLVGLAVLFLFVGAAWGFGFPLIAGAFLAGFSLASFPMSGLLRGQIGSLGDFFQAIFFTALGTLLGVSSLITLWHAVLLSGLVFVATPPIVALIAEWRGQTSRSGIESGLLLAQTSELGIVFALVGMQMGQIGEEVFTLLALVAAITMTVTPMIATDTMTWKLLHWHPSRRRPYPSVDLRNHVLVLGFGGAGMWVVKPLLAAGYEVLVVDDDPIVIREISKTKVAWWRGDGSDERTLNAVRAKEAKLVLAAMPRVPDLIKVIRYLQGVPVVARVFDEEEARKIERAGGVAILNSEAATEQFMLWFSNFCSQSKEPTSTSRRPLPEPDR